MAEASEEGGTRHGSAWSSPGFLLWHATLRWQRAMREALVAHDLTHVQFVLLASTWWLVEHGGPPTQRDLADHAGTDAMMTSQGVRALERAGLLERTRDPRDARALRLAPTAVGRAKALAAVRDVEAADRAFFAAADGPPPTELLRRLAGRDAAGRRLG